MQIFRWSSVVLASSSLLLINEISLTKAESTIGVIMSALADVSNTTIKAPAFITIDNDDLYNMSAITFAGMRHGGVSDAAVYTKTYATRRTMTSNHTKVVWHGVIAEAGRFGFATLVRGVTGHVVGTLTTEVATYDLVTLPDGNLHVRSTMWKNHKHGMGIEKAQENRQVLSEMADNVTAMSVVHSFRPDHSGTATKSMGEGAAMLQNSNRKLLRDGSGVGERGLQGTTVVDILVIVTNRAMCEYAGLKSGCESSDKNRAPINNMIPVLQAQTTAAMQSVGAPVKMRIVQVVHLAANGFDAIPDTTALKVIQTEYFQKLRTDAGADLVSMLTGDGGPYAGLAYLNSPESVVSVHAFGIFAFTHELGHNFGCYHDKETCGGTKHPYAHALRVPFKLRTVMAYYCPNDSCRVIPYYSSNGYKYGGIPIGDSTTDNARLIRENAPRVASWMPTKL